jgi:hypothetical protein
VALQRGSTGAKNSSKQGLDSPTAETQLDPASEDTSHDSSVEKRPPKSNPLNIGTWLQSQGVATSSTPIVTIADSKYIRALHSVQNYLEKWGRGQDLVVLCLDTGCVEDKTFNGYPTLVDGDEVMK